MRTDDSSIIQACLNGEPEAFGVLVDKYKAGIYAYVYSRINNFHDAQEMTQETFISAFRGLHSLKRYESFSFWLFRIASNQCKKWTRNQIRHPQPESIENMDQEMLEDSFAKTYREEMLDQSVREALNSLPETYREVLMLYYFSDMDSNEIAESLGISPTAIRMRLSRARLQFKEEMLAMMDKTFGEQKLNASFTFKIVEAIKRVKIQPISQGKGLPWGISLATGLIFTILSINPQLIPHSWFNINSVPTLASESKVLKVGEIPVSVLKTSQIPFMSNNMGKGKGGNPDGDNAFFMAPQAEGGEWVKKADMPVAIAALSSSVINGKIYAIGGVDNNNNNWISTVEEYDLTTDKWTKKADMPTARGGLSTAVVDGKIYAIGGSLGFSKVEEYDPETDKWTIKANMPTPRSWLCAVAVTGKIYAIGGWIFDSYLSTVEEYDPIADTWTRKADMPTARGVCSASELNGKIYVFGGYNYDWGTCSTVEEYNPATDTWTKKADMPTARLYLSTSVSSGKIYVIGGAQDFGGKGLSTVEEYDPVTDIWTKKPDMPTGRFALTSNVINGKIYAIGGVEAFVGFINYGKILSAVEEYTPEGWQSVSPQGKLPSTWGQQKGK